MSAAERDSGLSGELSARMGEAGALSARSFLSSMYFGSAVLHHKRRYFEENEPETGGHVSEGRVF